MIVPSGDVATLTIRVSGNPKPDVYWRKGRQTIDTVEGKFRLVDSGSLQVLSCMVSSLLLLRLLESAERTKVNTTPLLITDSG